MEKFMSHLFNSSVSFTTQIITLLAYAFVPQISLSQIDLNEKLIEEFNSVDRIVSFIQTDNGVDFDCLTKNSTDTISLHITFPYIDAIKVAIKMDNATTPYSKCHPFTFLEQGNSLFLATDSISIRVHKSPWSLDVYRKNRKMLSQKAGIVKSDSLQKIQLTCEMRPNEHFYGFGEKFNGFDQKGNKVVMELSDAYMATDDRTYKSIPFFISSIGYGLLVNSPKRIVFHMGDLRDEDFQINYPGASIEYYIFASSNPLNIISQYTDITGKPPLVLKWSLEPWLSRRSMTGWNNPATAEADIDMIIKDGYRLGVVLWEGVRGIFEGDHASAMHALSDKWHKMGIKQISWGYAGHVQKTALDFDKIEKSYFVRYANGAFCDGGFGGGKYYVDPTNAEAMNWWTEEYYKHRFANKNNKSAPGAWNLDGIKIDFCELFPKNDSNLLIHNKNIGMHNQHSVLFSKQIYDWLQEKKIDGGITWVRGGGLGIQTAGFSWGGDRRRTFKQMQGTVAASLGISVCGVSLIGHDLGGYRGDASPEAIKVYIRGVQYATFSPSFHDHGSAPAPWEQDENGRENYKFYSRVRYNILPYLYHYVKDSHATGIPMMRALVLQHPTDHNTSTIEDEYYLGDNLLIAPVVTASNTRTIYLPSGQWIDFWSGDLYSGGQHIDYCAPLSRIPVFAKAGTILPLELNNAMQLGGLFPHKQKNNLLLTFRFFQGPDSEFEFHDKKIIRIKKQISTDQIDLKVTNITESFGLIVDGYFPKAVIVNEKRVKEKQENEFSSAAEGWRFDQEKGQTLIKIRSEPNQYDYKVVLMQVVKLITKNDRENISTSPPKITRARGWDKSTDIFFAPVKNADSYIIHYWAENSRDKKEIKDLISSPVTLSNLENDKVYNMTMCSVRSDKVSRESDIISVVPEKHSPFFQPQKNKIFIRSNHSLKIEVEESTIKHTFGLMCPQKAQYTVWVKARKNEPHHRYFRWYKIGAIDVSIGENYFMLELLKKTNDIDMLYFTENKNERPPIQDEVENTFIEKSVDINNAKLLQF
jgi:alpha-glucosidase (family GH31 glycosyl hydrolase)